MKRTITLPLIFLICMFSVLVVPSSAFTAKNDDSILLPVEITSNGITSAGYVRDSGKIVIPFNKYRNTKEFSEGLAVIQDNKTGKYGAINPKGIVVIPIVYDELKSFSEGLAAARKKNSWGFINTKGAWVINPLYSQAFSFKEGVAGVQSPMNNKYGFINKLGTWIITPDFDTIKSFSEGLALVSKTKKDTNEYFFINKKAEVSFLISSNDIQNGIAPPALSFKDGLVLMTDYIVHNLTVFVVQVLTKIVSKSYLKEGRIMTILPQLPV